MARADGSANGESATRVHKLTRRPCHARCKTGGHDTGKTGCYDRTSTGGAGFFGSKTAPGSYGPAARSATDQSATDFRVGVVANAEARPSLSTRAEAVFNPPPTGWQIGAEPFRAKWRENRREIANAELDEALRQALGTGRPKNKSTEGLGAGAGDARLRWRPNGVSGVDA